MSIPDAAGLGRRIAEARARAGLTQAELASEAGLDRTGLAKIENGSRRVSALELARIAAATGESFRWFVSEPPSAVVSYRTGAGASTTSTIDRLVEDAARDVELLQSLNQLQVESPAPLTPPTSATEAADLAARARRLLTLDDNGPAIDLHGKAGSIGLYAFSLGIGRDSPDAATTLLRMGGVSVINSDRAVGRRRLALAHELAHYLVADPYVIDWRVGELADAQRTEALFDLFARCLLLPAGGLSARWNELIEAAPVREAAVRIASEYRVDMATLASRLAELELADGDTLGIVRGTSTTRADIIEFDLIVPYEPKTKLSRSFEKSVLALYRSERISMDRALGLLRGTFEAEDLPALDPVSEGEIWKFIS